VGLFSGISIKNLGLNDKKAWNPSLWNLAGSQSLSGENVTEQTALTLSAYWCGVNLIAGTVSTLPLHLQRKEQNKTIIAKESHIDRVLHSEFNPMMTAEIGRAVMMAHLLTWGNCYAEKVFNKMGELVELWPISPNRVFIEKIEGGQIIYRINVDNQPFYFNRERILHIPGLGFDGIQGYSVIAMARKSLGLAMALETFGSRYFGEGTHPSGIISHPLAIKDDNLRKALKESYAGLGKSHRLMLLEEGMKYEKIGIPPNDSQFIESKVHSISDVARWLNLPLHKLHEMSKSSFNNIESEQISFVTDSILLWLIRVEQNYDLQLLSRIQKKQNHFTRHNVDGLLRGNVKDRGEYYRIMRQIGAMSINDIREKENWDPVKDGDEHYVQVNEIPVSLMHEYWKWQFENKQQNSNNKTGDNSEGDEQKQLPNNINK